MSKIIRKSKQEQIIRDKNTFHAVLAMISILLVILIIVFLSFVYSKQIQEQFYQERSKNLLNVSSKVGDMMNSMITDVWSSIDTMEFQTMKKKDISADGVENWMHAIHESVCIKRENSDRDSRDRSDL